MKLEALGLQTAKINQLRNKGIESVEELVQLFPRKYLDFTKQMPFNHGEDKPALMGGTIQSTNVKGKNLTVKVKDELSSSEGHITFFGQAFLQKNFNQGDSLYIGGKVAIMYGKYFITPIMWAKSKEELEGVQPVYTKIKGMSDSYLQSSIQSALSAIRKDDYLEAKLLHQFSLIPQHKALRGMHQPADMEQVADSQKRHLFNELFKFNFHLMTRTLKAVEESPFPLEVLAKTTEFLKRLPFTLTDGQRDVLRGITRKIKDKEIVDALVMGDVGCGKTMVALLLMLGQAENGYQSVLVAPTNVLAVQHYNEAKALLEPLGINVAFLNGAVKVRERKKTLKGLADGSIDILIGTHACMGEAVEFNNLSMAVVDEEHRFGVKQRESIRNKVSNGLHMISMSATPIPRSLAVTLYGEHVSIHTIKTLPSGRKPVKISLHEDNKAPYQSILDAVGRGEQAYIVCPLIEDNDSDVMKDVKSVEEVFEDISARFRQKGVVVDFISGNMKEDEINVHLQEFKAGRTHVLISTTVIEVGVNVPNATVMVIENAERFGSSQLWQLKGRVGRGDKASTCHLVSSNPNPLSKEKLEMICRAKDGFEVAREDLRLRGAGSLLGDQQSGGNKYIQMMLQHATLNEEIRSIIKEILDDAKRKKRYKRLLQPEEEMVET